MDQRRRRSIRNTLINLTIAAFVIFVVFNVVRENNDDQEPPQYEVPDTSNELRLSDPASASLSIEVDGEPLILVMSKQDNARIETADLRVISGDPQGEIDQVGWLHTSMSIQRPVEALAYANGHVYVGKTREGTTRPALWVVDLSDPRRPFEANLLNAEFPIRSLVASDDGFMVAAGFDGEILVYDTSQPNEPEKLVTFREDVALAPRIELFDRMLFLNHSAGVIVYDLSNPESPERIGEIEHPHWSEPDYTPEPHSFLLGEEGFNVNLPVDSYLDLSVQGGLLALASGNEGVELYRYRVGEAPEPVGDVSTDDRIASVMLDGNRLYALGARPDGGEHARFAIHSFDISNPAEPTALESTEIIAGLPRYQNVMARNGNVWILVNSTVYRHQESER